MSHLSFLHYDATLSGPVNKRIKKVERLLTAALEAGFHALEYYLRKARLRPQLRMLRRIGSKIDIT